MARVVVWSSVALVFCGCDIAFRIDHVGDDSAPCDVEFADEFDETTQCQPWADSDVEAGAQLIEDGTLTVIPASQYGSRAGCFGNFDFPLGAGGVMLEVTEVIGGDAGEFSLLGFDPPVDLAIAAGTSELRYQDGPGLADYGRLPYDQSAMRWWRLRPDLRNNVVAEFSADARSWTPLGVPRPLPDGTTSVTVGLLAGYDGDQKTGTGKTVFQRLLVCR